MVWSNFPLENDGTILITLNIQLLGFIYIYCHFQDSTFLVRKFELRIISNEKLYESEAREHSDNREVINRFSHTSEILKDPCHPVVACDYFPWHMKRKEKHNFYLPRSLRYFKLT